MLNDYFAPGALALMMVALGMSLTIRDFEKLVLHPKALVGGVIGQALLLPLLGLGLIQVFQMSGLPAMNLMILVCCAGGVVSALLTRLAQGDVALSVSMTIVTLLIAVVSIPFVINTSLEYFLGQDAVQLSLFGTSMKLIAFTVFPVAIGMCVRFRFEGLSLTLEPYVSKAGAGLLVVTMGLVLIEDFTRLLEAAEDLFLVLFCLNVLAMLLGYGIGKMLKLTLKHKKTMAIEIGIQNSATGIFIATSLLHNPDLAVGSSLYTGIAFLNVAVLMLFWRYQSQAWEGSIHEK